MSRLVEIRDANIHPRRDRHGDDGCSSACRIADAVVEFEPAIIVGGKIVLRKFAWLKGLTQALAYFCRQPSGRGIESCAPPRPANISGVPPPCVQMTFRPGMRKDSITA